MKKITGFDQLKAGDTIKIIDGATGDGEITTVKKVLSYKSSYRQEDIIINEELNIYFQTNMLIKGKSWAKEVYLLESSTEGAEDE